MKITLHEELGRHPQETQNTAPGLRVTSGPTSETIDTRSQVYAENGGHRYSTGVVYVHGIGRQVEGEGLRAVVDALKKELPHRYPNRLVAVGDHPISSNKRRLSLSDPEAGQTSDWLIVEVNWEEIPPVVPFTVFATWFFAVAPWLIQTDAIRQLVRGGPVTTREVRKWILSPSGFIWNLIRLAVVAAFGIFVQVLVVVAVVMGVHPRPRAWMNRLLSPLGGDVDAFLQRAGADRIVSFVEKEILKAAAVCESVVVVGHSQGAALAHAAIGRGRLPDNVKGLVTLGSGLRKLWMVREAIARPRWLWTRAAIRLVASIGVLAGLVFTPGTDTWQEVGFRYAFLVYLLMPFAGEGSVTSAVSERIGGLDGLGTRRRWLDIWASLDPVRSGVLPLVFREVPGFESIEVRTSNSVFKDHNSYLEHH